MTLAAAGAGTRGARLAWGQKASRGDCLNGGRPAGQSIRQPWGDLSDWFETSLFCTSSNPQEAPKKDPNFFFGGGRVGDSEFD